MNVKDEAIYERDDHRCVRCGTRANNVHHRKLRARAWKWEVNLASNRIATCGSGSTGCHGWMHENPAEATKNGWIVASWGTPSDIPVQYPEGKRWLTDCGNYRFTPHPIEEVETL